MPEETLLPIYREFTDKEKLGLAIQRNKELVEKIANLERHAHNLGEQNKKLQAFMDDFNEELPTNVKNLKAIKCTTYKKLYRSFQSMTENFWRVNDELRELKKNLQSEKL